jgi:hypothetical protein
MLARCLFTLLLLAATSLSASEIKLEPAMSPQAIQAAINKPGRNRVVFQPGEYKLAGIVINPAAVQTVSCYGAKFTLPDNQNEYSRIFSILHKSQAPGAVLFEGGSFDLNEQAQQRESYSKEHQGAIFIDSTGGRLAVAISDVSITNSAGDGICIHRNALVSLDHVQATECFRSALTVSAGGNVIIANHLDVRGKRFRSGLRFEPSGVASRQIASTYVLRNVKLNYFNFQLGKGSLVSLSDSVIEPVNPAWGDDVQGYIYNEGGRLRMNRCQIRTNRQLNFHLTGDSRLTDCEFELCQFDEHDKQAANIALTLRWFIKSAGKFNDHQVFHLNACRFKFGNIDPQNTKCSAVRVFDTQYQGAKNRVLLTNCQYAAGAWNPRIRLEKRAAQSQIVERGGMLGDEPLNKNQPFGR